MISKIIKGVKKGFDASGKDVPDIISDSGAVVHKRVTDAKTEAQEILQRAKSEAEKIRKEAEAVLEDSKVKRDAAIKKGYAEGESKGLGSVTEKLMRLQKLKQEFYDNAEPEILRLVIAIAEKVVGRIVAENPEAIRSVVHEALDHALGDRITVRVNPEDYKTLMSGDHEFRGIIDRTKRLMFREDESISKGGCVVDTDVGTIDARIETQLEAIKKALTI